MLLLLRDARLVRGQTPALARGSFCALLPVQNCVRLYGCRLGAVMGRGALRIARLDLVLILSRPVEGPHRAVHLLFLAKWRHGRRVAMDLLPRRTALMTW